MPRASVSNEAHRGGDIFGSDMDLVLKALVATFLPYIICRSKLYCEHDHPLNNCSRSPCRLSSVCINHMSKSRGDSHSQMDKCFRQELYLDRDCGFQLWHRSSE